MWVARLYRQQLLLCLKYQTVVCYNIVCLLFAMKITICPFAAAQSVLIVAESMLMHLAYTASSRTYRLHIVAVVMHSLAEVIALCSQMLNPAEMHGQTNLRGHVPILT